MARRRNVYVRDRDAECWRLAGQIAHRERMSLSDLVARLLAEYVQRHGASADMEEARGTQVAS